GCESNVWFYGEVVGDRLQLNIYSDAKIVRGLIAIICQAFDGLSLENITSFDCAQFLEELGLLSHLSPSRGNGIRAIIEQITKIADKR
ncbi:MAG: SufE family protein, partial [Psychrobium sp.]